MPEIAPFAAELAATLARAVGASGVVCIGCPLVPGRPVPVDLGLITLSRPPLEGPFTQLERLLLAVAWSSDSVALDDCAAAGVPEVWLIDGAEELITSLTDPEDCRYRRRSLILPAERVRLAGLPEVEVVPLQVRLS